MKPNNKKFHIKKQNYNTFFTNEERNSTMKKISKIYTQKYYIRIFRCINCVENHYPILHIRIIRKYEIHNMK